MLKVLIGGIAVGLANIIPGVSGGTMLVILGLFNKVMDAISSITSRDFKKIKKSVIFLLILAVGAVIGAVIFANLLEFLFVDYPTQTMFCFVGMVAFSIPFLVKKEMKGDKFLIIPFLIGCAVIFAIAYFAPEETDLVLDVFPPIDFIYIVTMFFVGAIAGGVMFVPGVSGSMVLLIIGQYYLFKSLVANVTSFELNVIVPLVFFVLGVIAGIVVSSKLTKFCLEKSHSITMNFILGLVVASSVVLIPIGASYDLFTIISSLLCVVLGGVIIFLMEKIA